MMQRLALLWNALAQVPVILRREHLFPPGSISFITREIHAGEMEDPVFPMVKGQNRIMFFLDQK